MEIYIIILAANGKVDVGGKRWRPVNAGFANSPRFLTSVSPFLGTAGRRNPFSRTSVPRRSGPRTRVRTPTVAGRSAASTRPWQKTIDTRWFDRADCDFTIPVWTTYIIIARRLYSNVHGARKHNRALFFWRLYNITRARACVHGICQTYLSARLQWQQ